jgi:hypothetical protein
MIFPVDPVKSAPLPTGSEVRTPESREEADMERGWIETMQLLGLDVVLMATIAMLALDWLATAARPLLARLGAALRPRPRRTRTALKTAGQPEASWPPAPWRTSH